MLSDCIYIQRTMNIGHRILFIDLKYLMNKTLLTGLLCCTLTVQSFADLECSDRSGVGISRKLGTQ